LETQPIPDLLVTKLGRPTKQELIELYWIQLQSDGQIAQKYQVEPETVIEWIIKEDIPLRDYYESRQINYHVSGGVPAVTSVILRSKMPYSAKITSVVLHFPPGCSGFVKVNLQLDNGTVIFPYEGDYLNLDSTTQEFTFEYFLKSGTNLDCKIQNADAGNAHDVQVIVSFQRLSVVSVK